MIVSKNINLKSRSTEMRFACYVLVTAALVVSSSCTTPSIDTELATTSLRNSVFDECGWSAERSTLVGLLPSISKGRDGFHRTTIAVCAAAKGAGTSPGQTATVEVEGRSVRGQFLAPGENPQG